MAEQADRMERSLPEYEQMRTLKIFSEEEILWVFDLNATFQLKKWYQSNFIAFIWKKKQKN